MILLRQKIYSEKSVNLGGKRTKYSEMSEKQLKNLANYEEYKAEKKSTKEGRKDNRKRNLIGATSFAGIGAGVGFYPKYSKILKDNKVLLDNAKATEATKKVLKATGIGALSGLATWELLKIAANANHKHHAKLAKEELQRRGINDWKTGKTLKERNKEVLDEIKKEKRYSFLGFGKKETKIGKEEFIREFEAYSGHNKQAINEVKNLLWPGTKLPKDIEKYLSFLFEKYKEGKYRTGKDSLVFGYDEIIKFLKRWKKDFGQAPDKIFLVEGKKEGPVIYRFAWWARTESFWLFADDGRFNRAMFGLGDPGQREPMKNLEYII